MFKAIIDILAEHHITPAELTRYEYQCVLRAMEQASEQAFDASRAYRKHSTNAGMQVEIKEPITGYVYPRFIDFKLDKL